MAIHEDLTLGIDLGIGSCGWAVIRQNKEGGEIVDWGSRTFDVPETDKTRTPTNQLRRGHRGLRRVLKRRRQRMNSLRTLFARHGLIADDGKAALSNPKLDPWTLRAEGLDRRLSGEELAVALGHIAKHRGFKSNSKRQSNEADDDSKMKQAIAQTQTKLASYRSVGEMFAKDEAFAVRKRNRDGDYSRSVLRNDQEREARLLFDRQRHARNAAATTDLEQAFIDIAFFQRPLADSEDKVGTCPFELDEPRAAKLAPSFERFRFLSRLTTIRIQFSDGSRALTPDEIARVHSEFGNFGGMTFKRIRKILDLNDSERFDGVAQEDEGRDFATRRSSGGGCMQGTAALREALGSTWATLLDAPEKLDRIAFVLSFREDPTSISRGLEEIGLDPLIAAKILEKNSDSAFSKFKGAGHISAKACRAVIPYLLQGNVYDKAMALAGYRHTDSNRPDWGSGTLRENMKRQIEWIVTNIANPVAKKSMIEALKQTFAIVQEYGLPGHIHVELAREVGKSQEEREQIRSGIEKRNKAKDKLVDQFRETTGRDPQNREDFLRYELWKEQHGRCLYTDREIHPDMIISSDNSIQVDHILPWSRSGDDSFINKTLCFAGANQEKKDRTPFEWFGADTQRWQKFTEAVERLAMKGRKKGNYLLRDSKKMEETFRSRNLNDTKYATRVVLALLAQWYPDDIRNAPKTDDRRLPNWFDQGTGEKFKVRVSARPGPLTNRLRQAWGLQDLKKVMEPDGEKRKADDRHHALDALIVAATDQAALAELTRAVQEERKRGGHRMFGDVRPPWGGFVEEVREKFVLIFVSRAERHRARGEAHAATIRQIGQSDGETVVYERKNVEALADKDLARIKNPERNAALIENLRAWITDGKKKGTWPKSPKGDDIKKVRLATNKKPDVLIRDGAADRGEMVRVDVFRKKNKREKWEFFLVPVYPHQVADREDWPLPPNSAIQANLDEALWPIMDASYEFCWAIYPLSLVEIIKPDGEVIEGYTRGVSRSTGAFTISPQFSLQNVRPGIGARTLAGLRKLHVDRLGRKYPIEREARTWHGVVCT